MDLDPRAILRYILSPWVLAGVVVSGLIFFCSLLLILWLTRPGPSTPAPATAVLQVIQLPTATPVAPTPTPVIGLTPTSPVPPPPPGEIQLGAYVQVTGTGGDGLRIRSDPGLAGSVLFLGLESEVFVVKDGPRQLDDYTWWMLEAPYDTSVRGWAVSNYLMVVQEP